MLVVSYFVYVTYDSASSSDPLLGIYYFFEAFNEEFFFRGVLFVLLLSLTNIWIAYPTSLASFVLIHPQYYMYGIEAGIISTIVQAVLTVEIARMTTNIAGSWMLHGANRFFAISIYPLI